MDGHFLADLGKSIIAAAVVALPSYFIGIPLILAYLVAGVIIGPHLGFGFVQNPESISNISEIGLVLLMFILGLEINIKKLLHAGKAVTLSGSVQIIACLVVGYFLFKGVMSVLDFSSAGGEYEAIYLSVACALSSTLIVVKILSDQMDLDSLPSRITLGILVLQDFVAIGFLALQPNLANLNAFALIVSISKVLVLILISWSIARYILPIVFKKASRQPELMLIIAMAWCFAMCGVADYLHLSLEMGSLVAGISIASFPYHLDVAAKITSLRDFFITLFFVSLGLQIPLPTVEVLKLAVIIILFVLLSRVLTIYPTLHGLGFANRTSLLPALNLSQLSEFSLVLASLGLSHKHVGPHLLQAFVIALVVTALISSFLIPAAHTIYLQINHVLEKLGFKDRIATAAKSSVETQARPNPNLVLLGFYREASSLLFEIQQRFSSESIDKIMVVDFSPEAHQELVRMGINCQYGDISHVDTLRHLHLFHAKVIVCSIPDKILKGTTNLKLLKSLKQLAPKSSIIVTAENIHTARELYEEGASYVFIPRIIGATYLLDIIERLQMNGSFAIQDEAKNFLQDRVEVIP